MKQGVKTIIETFRRVSLAFDQGLEVPERDLSVVSRVLAHRLIAETEGRSGAALHGLDDALAPYEHAVLMTHWTTASFETFTDGHPVDTSRWFGLLVRPSFVDAGHIVERFLARGRRQRSIIRLVQQGVESSLAEICFDLAEDELRANYYRVTIAGWREYLVAWVEDEDEPYPYAQDIDPRAVWDQHSWPLPEVTERVALLLARGPESRRQRWARRGAI